MAGIIYPKLNTAFIDKIIYINLLRRPDRGRAIRLELNNLHIANEKVIRLEAIDVTPGYLGCAKSHLAALNMALENKWKNVLILEDDMAFNRRTEDITRVNRFFSMLSTTSWDVAMLSANYYKVEPFVSNHHFLKVKYAHCACAYMVNGNYYITLIENVREAVKKLEQGGKQSQCAIDAHWRPLMAHDNWFGVHPVFGYQREGVSDIQSGRVNYEKLFSKSLSDIKTGIFCL